MSLHNVRLDNRLDADAFGTMTAPTLDRTGHETANRGTSRAWDQWNVREAFNDPDWLFEPKWDGFRALAQIDGHWCRLVSRRDHVYNSWPYLCEEIAHSVRCTSAVLDGEIACLQSDGRSHFYNLMFRRDWPYFMAFDLLMLDGADLRHRPLHERKRVLAGIMPRVESRIRLVEGVDGRGVDFFRVACAHDLEGIVAKWKGGSYTSGPRTS